MKQIYAYIIFLMSGICFGWYANDFYGKPKQSQQTISVDIQPPKETIKNFTEKPIEFTDKKKYEKSLKDEENGISHYRFKSGDTDVYLSLEGLAFDVKIDSVEFIPQPIRFDTTFSYVSLDTLKVNNEKLMLLSGGLVSGYLIGKEDYKSAGVTLAITFVSVYFYDAILNIWKWL